MVITCEALQWRKERVTTIRDIGVEQRLVLFEVQRNKRNYIFFCL